MNPVFRAHGRFRSTTEGQILVTYVTGPWNRELIKEWMKEMGPVAMEVAARGPYVGIAVIDESMLCPPDAMELLAKTVKYSAESMGCLANLVVAAPGVEGRHFVEPNYIRMYEGVTLYGFFDTYEEARQRALEILAAPASE
jgi:hypothetical protein